MSRHSATVLPVLVCIAALASTTACATGSDVGGDPDTSASSTDPGDGGGAADSSATGSYDSATSSPQGTDAGSADNDSGTGADSGSGVDSGSGADSGSGTCAGYAAPDTAASCIDTKYCGVKGKPACNANGCDTTYYCEISSQKCVTKPAGC